MKVWSPLCLTAAVVLVTACPQDEPPPVGRSQPAAAEPQMEDTGIAAMAAPESAATAATPQPQPVEQPSTAQPRVQTQMAARVDQPFSTSYTGTVEPGMSEAQVVELWGQPVARRQEGAFTYLHYRNGCEASCGMYDIVIFESDQVVDAVVRYSGHVYAGVSSSPPGRTPLFTPPDSVSGGPDA